MPELEPVLVPTPPSKGRLSDVMLGGEEDPFAKPPVQVSSNSNHKVCFPLSKASSRSSTSSHTHSSFEHLQVRCSQSNRLTILPPR